MLGRVYARATAWLCLPGLAPRVALVAFLCTLPALAMGLQGDDYILREQVLTRGPFAAYQFGLTDLYENHALWLRGWGSGLGAWWTDAHLPMRFFRPLSSLSLWLDFAHGMPAWWMHLENSVLYAALVWLAIALYRRLGLSGAGLGWAAVFFGLDGALAVTAGWISGRNTLLAACFSLASVLVHDHARRADDPLMVLAASECFALSLLSAELGLCTLGYLVAYAWAIDRASPLRRVASLAPYALVTGAYLVHYVISGYGSHGVGAYRDLAGSPGSTLLAFVESIPIWLATTATVPVAAFPMFFAGFRWPVLLFSLVILALLTPIAAARWKEHPRTRMLMVGSVLSLIPLATVMPQDRLRFFVAFGVYGVIGPWVVSDFDATERLRRALARFVWRSHGVWLPLFFVPFLLSVDPVTGNTAAAALDKALPHANKPFAVLLNPPRWTVPWYQPAMRASRGEARPYVLALYAGEQSLELERIDDRTLELYAPQSWFAVPFDRISPTPFRAGTRIRRGSLTIELREVDATGAPLRVRFSFDRPLEDSSHSFWLWDRSAVKRWTPTPPGTRVQLPAASLFTPALRSSRGS